MQYLHHRNRTYLLILLTTFSMPMFGQSQDDQYWDGRFFEPFVGSVNAFVKIGSSLYIGGANITKWDGQKFESVGGGVTGNVLGLATDGTNLFVAGDFTAAGGNTSIKYVAQWDGNTWSSLGSGVNGTVATVAYWNGYLYAAGSFTSAGGLGSPSQMIARWNGSVWDSVGGNRFTAPTGSPDIGILKVLNNKLYVGGRFDYIAGKLCNNIAVFNGSSYDSLGSASGSGILGLRVRDFAYDGSTLYAIGDFTSAGGVAVNSIARWTGAGWDSLRSGLQYGPGTLSRGYGYAAAMFGGNLYAGGLFGKAGSSPTADLAQWNGSDWNTIADVGFSNFAAPSEIVYSLYSDGTDLYIGGNFNYLGPTTRMMMVGRWTGTRFYALGNGFAGPNALYGEGGPQAMLVDGNSVLVTGSFGGVGGAGGRVVRWDGIEWTGLNAITNGTVSAIAKNGSDIYIGGNFTRINGDTAYNVAHWNGSAWVAMGQGLDNSVTALVYHNGNVYAGGNFTNSGDYVTPLSYVAKWDGIQWLPLGTGTNAYVQALTFVGDTLYAGGGFTQAGGAPASFIAKWNGSTWSKVGISTDGVDNGVYSLLGVGNDLYVGGYFAKAGGITVNSVAKWNGSQWTGYGAGIQYLSYGQGSVYALAVRNGQLVVGGDFQSIVGSDTLFNVAYWDGAQWKKMGSGVSGGYVGALAATNDQVFAGGTFTSAGEKASSHFAVWNLAAAAGDFTPPSAPVGLVATDSSAGTLGLKWRKNNEPDFLRYRIYSGTSPAPSSMVDSTNGGIGDTAKAFTGLANGIRYYVRVTAVDSSGNESPYSNEVSALPADRAAPSAPQNLAVVDSSGGTIGIRWRKNSEADFLRYRIYRGTSPNPVTKVDSTTGGAVDTARTFSGLSNGTRYYLRVTAVDSAGNESGYSNEVNAAPQSVSYVDMLSNQVPDDYSIAQNYPNPFNPSTVIRYGLPERSHVRLEIFDLLGRRVDILVDEDQDAHYYEFHWEAHGPSSIYFYRLTTSSMTGSGRAFTQVRKMLFLK